MRRQVAQEWKEALRERADIVSVVSEYVSLRQKGKDFWGLCPFHAEKSASFKASSDTGLYYCFGCHAGGDVFDFVMSMERMAFSEAARYLADKFHVPLPHLTEADIRAAAESRSKREKILDINRRAAHYFHALLYKPEGEKALAYLHGRGLDDPTIRMFGLGAASASWDGLYRAMRGEGESEEDLLAAGLIVKKEGKSAFDMFRDRAIFPIIAEHGAVLGFGARAMGDANPKYLNTADTQAFNKRENVYAANLLKKVRNLQTTVLVEGYMDVVSLTRHGIPGVVATLGTALTTEQATYLARKAPEVLIAYDGDAAGQRAILRALDVFESLGKPEARVLKFPGGMDPDDFIRAEGRDAFLRLTPLSGPLFRMRCAMEGLDMAEEEGRTQYAIAAAAIIRRVSQPVERENLLKKLSLETGFAREVLLEQIGIGAAAPPAYKAPIYREKIREGNTQNLPDYIRAERILLSLKARGLMPEGTVEAERFADDDHRRLARLLEEGMTPVAILEAAEDPFRALCLTVFNEEIQADDEAVMEVITECLETMQKGFIKNRIADLSKRLDSVTGSEKMTIMLEITALNKEKERLRPGRKE